jgi:hypothetical protein
MAFLNHSISASDARPFNASAISRSHAGNLDVLIDFLGLIFVTGRFFLSKYL